MTSKALEPRIAALEAEVADLKRRLADGRNGGAPWWEQVAGTIPNDPMTRKAEKLGRAHRRSGRSKSGKGPKRHAGARHRSRQPAATR